MEKDIGETWNSTEPCVKHICERNDNGEPVEKTFREYCYLSCHNVRNLSLKMDIYLFHPEENRIKCPKIIILNH